MTTVLVTGCSSGIGLDTAALLAERGYDVVATLRAPERDGRGEAVRRAAGDAAARVDVRELDVADEESIARCVEGLTRDGRPVDVLVNNAGFGRLGSVEQIERAELERVMATNFGGVWSLTRALLPGMRERGSGRIVTVTSVGGILGQPFNDAYCAAKFAVEGMMESLAPVARQFGVHVSVVEPGPVNTEFVAGVRERSAETVTEAEPLYAAMMEAYSANLGDMFAKFGQTGADVARVILEVIEAEAPKLRYTTSPYAAELCARKLVDPSGEELVELFSGRLRREASG